MTGADKSRYGTVFKIFTYKKCGKQDAYEIYLRKIIKRTLHQIGSRVFAVRQKKASQSKGKEQQSPKALFMQEFIILGF